MSEPTVANVGLAEALIVAKGGPTPNTGESEAKLLNFMLRHGECDAEISEPTISVWYSWLPSVVPSKYFVRLAPGLVSQFMSLGGVPAIADEAIFQVGPGTAGTGPYLFDFNRKWVRIKCEPDRIEIRVRDQIEDLSDDKQHYFVKVRCERCHGVLRTPLAKQCLQCGFDWH